MRVPTKTLRRARVLRRKMTLPEVVLWEALRKSRLSHLRFRRQHPLGPYILDFYCSSARIAVEVDGSVHERSEQAQYDERRTAWLVKRGVRVLRFSANEILKDETLEYVLMEIAQACAAPSTAFGGPPPPLRGGGT